MREEEGMIVDGKEGYVLIDFETLQPGTLRALEAYVQACQHAERDFIDALLKGMHI